MSSQVIVSELIVVNVFTSDLWTHHSETDTITDEFIVVKQTQSLVNSLVKQFTSHLWTHRMMKHTQSLVNCFIVRWNTHNDLWTVSRSECVHKSLVNCFTMKQFTSHLWTHHSEFTSDCVWTHHRWNSSQITCELFHYVKQFTSHLWTHHCDETVHKWLVNCFTVMKQTQVTCELITVKQFTSHLWTVSLEKLSSQVTCELYHSEWVHKWLVNCFTTKQTQSLWTVSLRNSSQVTCELFH